MTMASTFRATGLVIILLLSPGLLAAQEQITPPSAGAGVTSPPIVAPVGHRQPRVADIRASEKTAAELQEERQQAELTRKLRICRGC